MTASLLAIAAQLVQLAPIAIAVLLGLLAVRALLGQRLRARPERRAAVGLAAVAALVLAGLVELLVAGLVGMDTGVTTQTYLAVLPLAIGAFVVGLLAGLAAYVALTRVTSSRSAALGGLIGAPILAVAVLGAGNASLALQNAAFAARSADETAVIEDRSSGIAVRTELLEATLDAHGTAMSTVRLRLTLRSDRDIAFEAGKSAWPRFTFSNVGQGQIGVEGLATDPQALTKGVDAVWELDFTVPPVDASSGTYEAPGPGRWSLRVLFVDTAGAEYDLDTEIDVQPTP